MKYAVLIGDGMSDEPIASLDHKTPLQVAATPNMDAIAKEGILGLVRTIPNDFPPGSDVANLSIMGYDPGKYMTGRGPLEAASLGLSLRPTDVAFRCNLVHLEPNGDDLVMGDYAAGHIPTDEARQIISILDDELNGDAFRFHAGVSYRHIMMWEEGKAEMETTPPHDILGKKIGPYMPRGEGADEIFRLMENAKEIFREKGLGGSGEHHPNAIWVWGQGRAPKLAGFREIYGLRGAIISAVDLIKGIGVCAGMEPIEVPGATGYLDTNYRGKGEYAVAALSDFDFVYVHVEAPDEAAHSGSVSKKVEAIEAFDREVVGRVFEGISKMGPFAIMVLPDHATPISKRTHTSDPVPFAIYGSEPWARKKSERPFDEASSSEGGLFVEDGHCLLGLFIQGKL